MSDIVTRLLLKTNDFDANLEKSKGSVNRFQGDISNMAKSAGAGIAKFAAGVGLAMGAGESFMKVIRSTQSTSDEFDNTLNACKGTVDIFFQSLSSGSFEAFNNGILSTISNMKNLSALRDSLADAKLSMGFNNKVFEAEFTKFESIIRDTTKSRKERESAFKSLQSLKDNFKVDVDDTLSGAEKELIQSLNTRTGRKDFNIDDIHKYISINNNDFSTRKEKSALTAYRKQLSEYDKQMNLMRGKINSTKGDTNEFTGETKMQMRQKLQDLETQKRIFIQQNAELEKQNFLNQDNDANRIEMTKNYEYTYDLKKRMYDFDKRTLELQNSLKGSAPKETPKVDSVAWYDTKISELNKKLISETDVQIKSTIKATINELERKKIKLQIEESGNSIEAINIQLAAQNKKLIAETDMQARATIQATINELEQKKVKLKFVVDQEAFKIAHGEMKDGALPIPIKPTYDKVPTHGKTGKDFKLPKHDPLFKKEDIDLNQEYAESLANISGVVGSMSGLFDDNTASVLQWGVSFLSTVGQAIPKILEMAGANEVEAETARKSAIANMSAAGGEVLKAHAGIPFVGIALGLAGVATIIAAMSSMPKYATGGIVPGTSFTGDKVPALLNSGEMILNGSQQSNLFRMLNSGLYGSLSQKIAPSGNDDIRLYSDVEIKGDRIFLALHNHIKKTGKRLW